MAPAQASNLSPDFAFVSVFDLEGTMRAVYPSQPTILNQNFAYRDWYKGVARQWNPYISEVYQTAVAPYQLVVAIVVPVKDDAGKPIGILMAPCCGRHHEPPIGGNQTRERLDHLAG